MTVCVSELPGLSVHQSEEPLAPQVTQVLPGDPGNTTTQVLFITVLLIRTVNVDLLLVCSWEQVGERNLTS